MFFFSITLVYYDYITIKLPLKARNPILYIKGDDNINGKFIGKTCSRMV